MRSADIGNGILMVNIMFKTLWAAIAVLFVLVMIVTLKRVNFLESLAVATARCQSDGSHCLLISIDSGLTFEFVFVANGIERVFYCTRIFPWSHHGCSGPHLP